MKNGVLYFTAFMGFLYITIGVYVMLGSNLTPPFDGPVKYALGGLMFLYGGFRLYSFNQKRKNRQE